MAELFTTFESVSPPDIIAPDVQLNYREILLMLLPTLEVEDSDINWSFLDEPVCMTVNQLKSDFEIDTIIYICKQIVNNYLK